MEQEPSVEHESLLEQEPLLEELSEPCSTWMPQFRVEDEDLEKPPQYCLPGPSSKYQTVTIAPQMAATIRSFIVIILTSSGLRICLLLIPSVKEYCFCTSFVKGSESWSMANQGGTELSEGWLGWQE